MTAPDLDAIFSALADPTRRAILERLAAGDAPVNELAKPFNISAPAITKHLNVLERAGLISRGRDAQRRPCSLNPEALRPAAGWLDTYRRYWNDRLDRLEHYLQDLAQEESHDRD